MHVFFVLKLYVLNWKSVKESHFFLSPGRTNPLSKNYISEVFSISKQRSIYLTNMYFSTSFSIYIYMLMYIFSLSNYFAAILHCRICPISTIFPNFFFIAESLYFLIQLLIRLQHLSLSLVLVYVRYWIMKSI